MSLVHSACHCRRRHTSSSNLWMMNDKVKCRSINPVKPDELQDWQNKSAPAAWHAHSPRQAWVRDDERASPHLDLPVFGFASKEKKIHIEIIKKISNQSDRIFTAFSYCLLSLQISYRFRKDIL